MRQWKVIYAAAMMAVAMPTMFATAQTVDQAAPDNAEIERLDLFYEALNDPTLRHHEILSDQIYCLGNWVTWAGALKQGVDREGLPDALLGESARAQQENWSIMAKLSLARQGRRADYPDMMVAAAQAAATQLAVVGETSFLGDLGGCFAREVASAPVQNAVVLGQTLRDLAEGEYQTQVLDAENPVILAIVPRGRASRRMLKEDLGKVAPVYPQARFLMADPDDLGEVADDMRLERFPVLVVMSDGAELDRTTSLFDSHGYSDWVGARLALISAD